jgi:hypothetical protein
VPDFEQLMADFGAIFRRPDRKGEQPRFGGLGASRQWIESVFDTFKGQLSLEDHGAVTMPGLMARIAARLLALAACLWHNWASSDPGRHLTAYDHQTRQPHGINWVRLFWREGLLGGRDDAVGVA